MTAFGHAMLEHWRLDPEVTYLNHGTVGAVPRTVLDAQTAMRDRIERAPAAELAREIVPLIGPGAEPAGQLRAAAGAVAAFLGARGDDLVFVDNATAGVVSALNAVALKPGDEILVTNLTYGAITHVAQFAARKVGAKVVEADIPFPPQDAASVVASFAEALTDRTRVVIVDHVTSNTALILPVAEIAALCRSKGVPTICDGAHAPGAIPVDIGALGVDWYTANMHKWAMAPRACGVLWAAPDRQADLHPPVISWGLDQGWRAEFDWVGTRDLTAYLAAPAGLDFMRELGVEAMRHYNHDLVLEAAAMLAGRWGTSFATDPSMIGTMATVPLPAAAGSGADDAAALRDALWFEDRIEAHVVAPAGPIWVRLSVQVYNEISDYEKLAEAVLRRAG